MKRLTGTSSLLFLLTVVLFIIPVLTLGYACLLCPLPGCSCGIALFGPWGVVMVGAWWPLVFVPAILVMVGFIYSVKLSRA